MPRIQDILDRLGLKGDDVLYTTVDVRYSYFRFQIPESDRDWTVFTWNKLHYRFKCAPFGIKTMTSMFQMVMEKLLGDFSFVAVYLDDITIFSCNREEHVEHVRMVIERVTMWNVPIRAEKSRFGQKKVKLLGFIISGRGVEMDPNKVEARKSWTRPKTVRHLLRFLGAANWYRQFIRNFSSISHSLDAVRKQKGIITWTATWLILSR